MNHPAFGLRTCIICEEPSNQSKGGLTPIANTGGYVHLSCYHELKKAGGSILIQTGLGPRAIRKDEH